MKQAQAPELMSFEQAMGELEGIVRQLENGQVPLEDAIKSYERGALLKKRCESLLNDARLKIEEVILSKGGDTSLKPSTLAVEDAGE